MDTKTLSDLAYYRIRDDISGFCATEEGRAHLCTIEPASDDATVEARKAYGREWQMLLVHARAVPFTPWQPVAEALHLSAADGAALTLTQLHAICQFCASVQAVCRVIEEHARVLSLKTLAHLSSQLPKEALEQARTAILRVIDTHGELRDLPSLRKIRARIAAIQSDITRELRRYTSDVTLNTVLESNVPAYRAERQVLAVKASQKTRIHGIVHEVSQSGQTVYIEPAEVVLKNNELVQEESRMQAEVRAIRAEVTATLRPLAAAILAALDVMVRFDTTLAAARWGMEHHCVYALPCRTMAYNDGDTNSADNNDEAPLLLQARHPLLGTAAVPVTIVFRDTKRVLIITGANTGGKTVALKTFALLALLNQAGFPVPAAEGTRLPVFTDVFADIGDEQSIDQSLSTFSAHMRNLARAVKDATNKSLIVLDELGSGTDPQEGGAIAMAVLDTLIKRRSFVLVTTHQSALKTYGYTNSACDNASVEFDADTLSPTYRLVPGVPGESHALDIARKSGLPLAIIAQAERYLADGQTDVSALIAGLTEKHARLDERLRVQEEAELHLQERVRQQDERALQLREQELSLKERELRDESVFVAQTRRELENLVRTLREGEITREKTRAVRQFVTDISAAIVATEAELTQERNALEQDAHAQNQSGRGVRSENGILLTHDSDRRTIRRKHTKRRARNKEALAAAKSTYSEAATAQRERADSTAATAWVAGAEVFAGRSRRRGTLVREERTGVWTVQLGSMRMSFQQRDLVLAPPENAPTAKASVTVELSTATDGENAVFMKNGATAPVFELRLLGLRAEEALRILRRQLDLCAMQNFKTFSVVHGKGNGVLQQVVQDYLSSYPAVQEFHFAPPEEGGTGKTYVTMR